MLPPSNTSNTTIPTDISIDYLSGYHRFCLEKPGVLDYISQDFCDMLGYSSEEVHKLFNDKYSPMVYKDDYKAFMDFIHKLASKEQTLFLKYRLVCKDGHIISVNDITTSCRLTDGRMYAFSLITEVSDTQSSKNVPAISAEVLQNNGFILCSNEKFPRVLHMNQKMKEFLNVTEENSNWLDYVTENIFFMIPYNYSDSFRNDIERAKNSAFPVRIEHIVICSDNHNIALSGWMNFSRNEYGEEQIVLIYTKKTTFLNSTADIRSNPYYFALKSAYDIIFAFSLSNNTVECIHGRETTSIGTLFGVDMTIESGKSFWLNNHIDESCREDMRVFLDSITAGGKWPENFNPMVEFRINWVNNTVFNYIGIGVQLDIYTVLLCCKRTPKHKHSHEHVHESIALTKLNTWLDYDISLERHALGMVLLEETNNEYSLIYSTKRLCNYFGITKSDYLHYISGKFPLEKLLETAEMTHEDFNTLISTNSLTLSAKNKQTGTTKQVQLNCEPYEHDGSNLYPIWVYDSSSKGNSIPGTATASQGNGTQAAPIIPTTGIFIRTFGHFDVFVDGTPVKFTSSKEKELMALLIDRNGGTISSREAISYLWEDEDNDEKVASRYRKLAMNLKNTLSKYGIEHILINNHGVRSIDVTAVTCDYYEMLGGNEKYQKTFHNIYMSDYSWAEDTLATLWEYS